MYWLILKCATQNSCEVPPWPSLVCVCMSAASNYSLWVLHFIYIYAVIFFQKPTMNTLYFWLNNVIFRGIYLIFRTLRTMSHAIILICSSYPMFLGNNDKLTVCESQCRNTHLCWLLLSEKNMHCVNNFEENLAQNTLAS